MSESKPKCEIHHVPLVCPVCEGKRNAGKVKLTPAQRKARAKRAAEARWKKHQK